MKGPDEIREVFAIFHDGWISRGTLIEGTGEIEVQVEYLAERIRPGGRAFMIRLEDLHGLKFSPWTGEGQPTMPDITELPQIAQLEPGLLCADCVDHAVRVACTLDRPNSSYCGGFLEFVASGCRVFDESGREWDLEGLRGLSDAYWSEWSSKNNKAEPPK